MTLAQLSRDKNYLHLQNIFVYFTAIRGLKTIFEFLKKLFVDPIILIGFVKVFQM